MNYYLKEGVQQMENKSKPQADQTIKNHMEQAMSEMFGIKPEIKGYKFNIQFHDGKTAEVGIKEPLLEQARESLNYWYPNIDIELGFKEL